MTDTAGREGGYDFPCASLDEALPELRRPPAPAAVRFKLTATNRENTSGQVAAYVDARLVFDRLDLVCGGRWHARFEALPERLVPKPGEGEAEPIYVRCRLTAFGVTREDVGAGETPKAAFSDAIKRAAVHFGVGRALYAMASPWLVRGPGAGQLRTTQRGKLKLDLRTEAHLRGGYERWLAEKGSALFGPPLEHGDEAGAAGFERVEGERRAEVEDGGAEGRHAKQTGSEEDGRRREPDPEQAPAETGLARGEPEQAAAEPEQAAAEPEGSPAEPEQTPAGAQPSQADVPGHVESAGLRAVVSTAAGGPPATPQERRLLAHWRQAGGYREQTVAQLARLATGEGIVDRLTRERVRRVGWLLELAVGGRVKQATLQGTLTRLAKQGSEPDAADELLEQWLRRKYDEVGLLGRREAA
jgi:Rad52/22 family double-strand break repair protein